MANKSCETRADHVVRNYGGLRNVATAGREAVSVERNVGAETLKVLDDRLAAAGLRWANVADLWAYVDAAKAAADGMVGRIDRRNSFLRCRVEALRHQASRLEAYISSDVPAWWGAR